jgi:hypothetical protein
MSIQDPVVPNYDDAAIDGMTATDAAAAHQGGATDNQMRK